MFGFLPRPQLAEIVSLIGDWYFAGKVQYYLHECGKITLGELVVTSPRNGHGHGPVVLKEFRELPLADAPMPGNVKNFKEIHIWFINK